MSAALGIPGVVIPAAAAAAAGGGLTYQGYAKTGNRIYPAGVVAPPQQAAANYTQNILRAYPWIARVDGTINQFSLEVSSSVGGSLGRAGIYANNSLTDPRPAALLWESAELDIDTAGYITAVVTGVTVSAGDLLWLALVNGGANAGLRSIVSGASGLERLEAVLGMVDGVFLATAGGGIGFTIAHAFGALPNPYGAGTILESAAGVLYPWLCLRYA